MFALFLFYLRLIFALDATFVVHTGLGFHSVSVRVQAFREVPVTAGTTVISQGDEAWLCPNLLVP